MEKTTLTVWACTFAYAAIGLLGFMVLIGNAPNGAALTAGYGIAQTRPAG